MSDTSNQRRGKAPVRSTAAASIDAAVPRERARVEADHAKAKPKAPADKALTIRNPDRAADAAAKAAASAVSARRARLQAQANRDGFLRFDQDGKALPSPSTAPQQKGVAVTPTQRPSVPAQSLPASGDPKRTVAGLERAVAAKANVRIIEGPGSSADTKSRDTLGLDTLPFAGTLGLRKEAAPARVVFRDTTLKSADDSSDPFAVSGGRVSARKQQHAPQAIGYVRANAPRDEAFQQRFRKAGATELRWEGAQGRNVRGSILHGLDEGDTIILEKVSDLALPTELGRVVKQVQDMGAHVVALDGSCDTRTEKGRAAFAKIVTTLGLFGPRA